MNKSTELMVQNISIAILKDIISKLPIVGSVFNEVIFELRSKIKQERLNTFIEELSKYFSNCTENEIDIEYIKSENFSDIFESVFKHVLVSNNKNKIERLKNILINQIKYKYIPDHTETFLDLITRIDENAILILNCIREIDDGMIDINQKLIDRSVTLLGDDNSNLLKKKNYIMKIFNLSEDNYTFYVQDLFSKGLLLDDGINRYGTSSFELMNITKFGRDFLDYIKEPN